MRELPRADITATNARDGVRPDVLYVVHRLPYPPDKGDRIRAYHLLKWLSRRAAVHLAALSDEPPADESIEALRGCCEHVAVIGLGGYGRWARAVGSLALGRTATEGAFWSPALRNLLGRWARRTRFHAALGSSSSMVPYLRLPELREVPKVVDLVDVDSQKWLDYAEAVPPPLAWLYQVEGHRLRRLEQGLPTWTEGVSLVSAAEADLYRRFQGEGEGTVRAITNGVDLNMFRPEPSAIERGCVFVGGARLPAQCRWSSLVLS